MPADAIEILMLNQLVATLQPIGSGVGVWRTSSPAGVDTGVDFDALPESPDPLLRAVWTETTENQAESGGATALTAHGQQARFSVFCFAETLAKGLNLAADVRDAVRAAEGAFTSQFQQPLFIRTHRLREDIHVAGKHAVEVLAFLDFEMTHAA